MSLNVTDVETEYAGALRIRILHIEINGYNSNGEPLGLKELGMTRLIDLDITPDGAVFNTAYDFENYELLTDLVDGENAEVKVTAKGR